MNAVSEKKIYEKYMKKCISLAKKSEGFVSPNPLVGAVVLDKNGNLCGTGRHKRVGEAHAEVNALKKAGEKAEGGTIIVNLEPCSHYGKTPPCADLIIEKGIKTVVAGILDPNPIVSGNGVKKLKAAGINVITGVLENDCRELNEIFFKNKTENKPFIAIKSAVTLDGKIATKTGSSKWITSEKSRLSVQKLRNKYDAILTGSNTIITDNPSLTARIKNGRNPVRVIIDSCLKTPPAAKAYTDDGVKVFIAVSEFINPALKNKYPNNIEFIHCPLKNNKIDLNYLTGRLFEKGIYSILIEAGGDLCGQFIKDRLIDKVYLYTAPKATGDIYAKQWISGFALNNINDACQFDIKHVKFINPDILCELYPKY